MEIKRKLTMAELSEVTQLREACKRADATPGMRRLLGRIYALSGFNHAMATIRAWIPNEEPNQ